MTLRSNTRCLARCSVCSRASRRRRWPSSPRTPRHPYGSSRRRRRGTAPDAPVTQEPADEITAVRGYYERWVAEHSGRTMVGLCGVPQRRWRGLMEVPRSLRRRVGTRSTRRSLPTCPSAPGSSALPPTISRRSTWRRGCASAPVSGDNDLQRWFWAETAAGAILAKVAERLAASDDESVSRYAQGVAR